MARAKPLNIGIGEGGWGHSLILPPGPGLESCQFLYRHVLNWVRIMAKLEEFYDNSARFEALTMSMVRAADDLGVDVVLCIDGHNPANDMSEYHLRRFTPPDPMKVAVKKILRAVGLKKVIHLEGDNEAYWLKGNKGLRTHEYRDIVVEPYMEGAAAAGFNGPIWAAQTGKDFRDFPSGESNYWERTVSWPHGMVEARHSWILNRRPTDPDAFRQDIIDHYRNEHRPENQWWKGWEHPMCEGEFSSTRKQIHCNTQKAYDLTEVACQTLVDQLKVPFGWLTVGGDMDEWPRPGHAGWGMSTHLVKSDGEFSQVARALADYRGVDLPDAGEPPIDPPGDGMRSLERAEVQIGRAKKHWGKTRGVRHAQRAIGHIENAIGRA